MQIQVGYLYHIKDSFFTKINDPNLMKNHENGHSRPTYLTIKDGDLLWFVPLSRRIDKYQNIINKKIKQHGSCKTILIRKIAGEDSAILLQNAFPILPKYIGGQHIINGNPIKVIDSLKREILKDFKFMLSLKKQGMDLFFTDIDLIKEIMIAESKK